MYVVDATADRLIKEYGLKPDEIDTAYKLSHDYNDESNSKQTFKITLTCPLVPQSIYRRGAVKVTKKEMFYDLLTLLQDMPQDFVDSPVIQMEVEEVNQSQNATTKQPCNTKEQCSKNTMYAR